VPAILPVSGIGTGPVVPGEREGTMPGGPRTKAGKEIARLNSVAHGLRSALPVIPGETAEGWERHREAILASLAAQGALEEVLAERVALLLWRLGRVARYETATIANLQERIDDDIAREWDFTSHFSPPPGATIDHGRTLAAVREKAARARSEAKLLRRFPAFPDTRRLSAAEARLVIDAVADAVAIYLDEFDLPPIPGIPEGTALDDVARWTAGQVRALLDALAATAEDEDGGPMSPAEMIAQRAAAAAREGDEILATVTLWERTADRMRRERTLPGREDADKVMRYEAHLHRQLIQTLHELEAMQDRRAGGRTPLARLDVSGLDATE